MEFKAGDAATDGVSASNLESVGALTEGASVGCAVFPCFSLMESSFLGSIEGATPEQKQKIPA